MKKSIPFLLTVLCLCAHPVFLYAQQLFSVSQTGFSHEKVTQLTAQVKKSEVSTLSLSKNNESKNVYQVTLSTVPNSKIIILNEQTGNNVVIIPTNQSFTEFQLAPFFIEELKQGVLGAADHYLVMEATADDVVHSVVSVSASNGEVFLPRYFYGAKENVKEALPTERQIIGIFKAKPQLISAFPDDPEVQRQIAQWEEEMSYYIYMFHLPDGTLCTYDEHFNSDREPHKSRMAEGPLEFALTGQLTTTERNVTVYALNLWSQQLAGKVPVDIKVDFIAMESPSTLARSFGTQTFLNTQNNTWYPSSLWNQLVGYDASTLTNDIILEFNSRFNFYYGTNGNTPYSQYDYVTIMLHEVNHGLGFTHNIYMSNPANNGVFYYIDFEEDKMYSTEHPNTFTRQLFQGTSGPCITELTPAQRAALVVSGNLYAGRPGGNLLAANGGSRVKMYAPNPFVSGSSIAHWDESVSFTTFMKWAIANGTACHTIGARELGILLDMGWTKGESGACAGVTNMNVNFNANCEAQITWSPPNGKMLTHQQEENEEIIVNEPDIKQSLITENTLVNTMETDISERSLNSKITSATLAGMKKSEILNGNSGKAGEKWIYWCGNHYDGIGDGDYSSDFYAVIRFTPADLTAAGVKTGDQITAISLIPYHDLYYEWTLGIWSGATTLSNPGTLDYQQNITQTVWDSQWNDITLNTPYTINASKELWFGYRVKTYMQDYPAGTDAGPRVPNKGDIYYDAGGWTTLYDVSGGTINYNWNIRANVVSNTPVVCAYNVYRDDTKIASNITTTSYTDRGLDPNRSYKWSVKVACDGGGESAGASVSKGCHVGINENEDATISVYPNPTTGVLHVTSYELQNGLLSAVEVEMFDVMGKKISSHHLIPTSSHQTIDISHFPAGIYFLRIETEDGVVMRKVIKN